MPTNTQDTIVALMRTIASIPSVPEKTRRRAMEIYSDRTGEKIDDPFRGFSDIFEEMFGMGGHKRTGGVH